MDNHLTSETLIRGCESAVARAGETVVEDGGTTSTQNDAWVTFARLVERPSRALARSLAQILDDAAPYGRVLDVAAGHGRYGIEIVKRHAHSHAYALDWPRVLDVARETAASERLGERFHTLPGDAFQIDWGRDYDLVLLINYLRHYSLADCQRLVEKARHASRAGGRVVALEAPVHEGRVTPGEAGQLGEAMATTPRGGVHTFEEYQHLFTRAGLAHVEFRAFPGDVHYAIVATR